MKIFGVEGTITEFTELASHISVNIAIIALICFLLWQGRKHLLKLVQYIGSYIFKKQEGYKKIKCKNCKKKKFSATYKNISEILSPSGVVMFCPGDYRQSGDFLICNNCRHVVGIWRSDSSLDQYIITDQSSWNDLLLKYKVCYNAYDMHSQWIKEIDYTGEVCIIEQTPTLEMNGAKVNLMEIKRIMARNEAFTNINN